jgi:hypothetical protein
MIELSWSGLRVPAIAVELDCSQKTVRCWLHRSTPAPRLPAGRQSVRLESRAPGTATPQDHAGYLLQGITEHRDNIVRISLTPGPSMTAPVCFHEN